MKRIVFLGILLSLLVIGGFKAKKYFSRNANYEFGQAIDSLNGVLVYYNGSTNTVKGRTTIDGYNIGLKYQCVEFVKRYYFQYYHHRMPDSYGHAVSFFDPKLVDGTKNEARDLFQFTNPSSSKPKIGDLIVMGGGSYGHVCIVSQVLPDEIEIIQQNPGVHANSRIWIDLEKEANGKWRMDKRRILGWLRK
jgi:hypothetical protein